jgi:preprotein translocase subunit SecD
MIDDSADRFVTPAGSELPGGVTLEEEHITWGTQASHPRFHFVHLLPRPGEDLAHALASIDVWLRGFELPSDARLGWQELRKLDEASGKQVFDGWRSLVLRGPALITDADFVSVAAAPGYDGGSDLVIVLSPAATETFRIATRDHVHQRIALIVEGLINSAPIILSEIPGGKLHVLLDDSKDFAEVVRLVKLLTPPAKASAP